MYLDLPVWLPHGAEKRVAIYHPLGSNWHPLEGAGLLFMYGVLPKHWKTSATVKGKKGFPS